MAQDGITFEEASLSVPGNPFVLDLTCPACFRHQDVFRLSKHLAQSDQTCAGCGALGTSEQSPAVVARSAMGLVNRALVVWIVVISGLTVFGSTF